MSETFGIRALADEVGVAPHTLRYYEDAGLMLDVARDAMGRRAYTSDHVKWVKFLLNLREGGMGITQMRRYVELIQSETDGGIERFAMLEAHREEVKRRVQLLGVHLKVLNTKLAAGCGPDQTGEPERMTEQAVDRRALEVVAELYRLFAQGRLDETLELMHPAVTLNEPGDPAVAPWAGEFEGHEGVRAFYAGLAAAVATIEIDPASLRFLAVEGRRVLALGTERGTVKGTGREYVTESAWLWTVRDGLITELAAFHDTAEMVAALTD